MLAGNDKLHTTIVQPVFAPAKLLLIVKSESCCLKTTLLDLRCMTTYTLVNESQAYRTRKMIGQQEPYHVFPMRQIPYETSYALKNNTAVLGETQEGYYQPLEKAELVRDGGDVTILCYSRMRYVVMQAVQSLEKQGFDPEVIAHTATCNMLRLS